MCCASEGSPGILLDRVPPALRKPRFPGHGTQDTGHRTQDGGTGGQEKRTRIENKNTGQEYRTRVEDKSIGQE